MKRLFLCLAVLLCGLLELAPAAEFTGLVVGVTDGDTIKVLTPDKQEERIRLIEIDAPEKSQPYGQKAKQALSDLAFQRTARVQYDGRDKYGRILGLVYVDGREINAELVRAGDAWVYEKYVTRREYLKGIKAEARAARRGLWGLSEAERIPPWEWRIKMKSK